MNNIPIDWVESDSKLIGNVYKNNKGYSYRVLKYYKNVKKFLVEFESGYITTTYHNHIKSGNISDKLSPSVYGIGILGYSTNKDNPRAYQAWKNMISRCYVEYNSRYYTYGAKGVRVCDRWLRFDYYLEDLPLIEGYDELKYNNGELVLDKDMKYLNNTLYSKDTCIFVSEKENIIFSNKVVKKVKALNCTTNEYEYFNTIIDFAHHINSTRYYINKYANTNLKFNNYLIYLEE